MSSFFLDQATAKRYAVGRAFIYEGRQYTSAGANPTKFAELGFIEVQIDPRPDDRFYINNGQCKDDGSWDSTPRDLEDLKYSWISDQHTQQGSILSQTDWMVVRKADTGRDIPADVNTFRTEVRRIGDERVFKIEECSEFSIFVTLVTAPAFIPDPKDPDKQIPNPAPHLEPWPEAPELLPKKKPSGSRGRTRGGGK